MPKITIVGLGLIGTSVGLALKRYARQEKLGEQLQVAGYDVDLRRAQLARSRGAVDSTTWTIEEAVEGTALVILAVPVMTTEGLFRTLAECLPDGSAITDTASTKSRVMAWARDILSPRGLSFVGGHPMAGATAGPEAASEALFDNCAYCLTPAPDASPDAVGLVHAFVRALGAKPLFIDPDEHDSYVAAVSHLPFVMSTALMNLVAASGGWMDLQKLAASGFRDTSRLASGDPTMYRDVCLTNREAITHWIDRYLAEMEHFRQLIATGQGDALLEAFQRAKVAREQWLRGEHPAEAKPPTTGLAQLLLGEGWMRRHGTMRQEGGKR